MTVTTEKRYTPEEYFQLEETATDKHEYLDGKLIVRQGNTVDHNRIEGNFFRKFPPTGQSQNHEIFINEVRLSIPAYRFYAYPDMMIVKEKPILEIGRTDTITNPRVIIEILSEVTRGFDRGDKFKYYRSLETLEEYILIDQYSFYVEQFHKQGDHWEFRDYQGEEAVLTLLFVDFQIPFADLYQRVDFSANEG